MAKTRYYKNIISVTDTEQIISLEPLTSITMLNVGDNDCLMEFDGDVSDTDSATLYQGIAYSEGGSSFTTLHLKCDTGETTTVQIQGVKQFKE